MPGFVCRSPDLKIIIVIAFVLIIASLGSAMVFLIRDKGRTHNTVRALALRVGFSVALFIFILIAHQLGWIQSTGVPVGPAR
jgi:hypothetical protein